MIPTGLSSPAHRTISASNTSSPFCAACCQSTDTGISDNSSSRSGAAPALRERNRNPACVHRSAVTCAHRFHGGVKIGSIWSPKAARSAARPIRRSSRCRANGRLGPNSHFRPPGSWFSCRQPCWWRRSRLPDRAHRPASSSISRPLANAGITARSRGNPRASNRSRSGHNEASPHPTSSLRKKMRTGDADSSSKRRKSANVPPASIMAKPPGREPVAAEADCHIFAVPIVPSSKPTRFRLCFSSSYFSADKITTAYFSIWQINSGRKEVSSGWIIRWLRSERFLL